MWGFPNIRGTVSGDPRIGTTIFRGLYWGSPILGNYHIYIYAYRYMHIYAIHTHAETIYVMYRHVCMYTYTRLGFAVWELGVRVSGLLDMTGGWHGARLSILKVPKPYP